MDKSVSKSQKKREADALQEAGLKFVDLGLSKLGLLPLPENLRKAIIDAKSIKSHGAKRRQAQLIGKLMRFADHEKILADYQNLLEEDSSLTASFHEVELWRDRLIHEGKNALTSFIESYHPQEVQRLRQLIKKAIDDHQQGKNTGASKALFRYLRSCMI